MSEPTTAQIVAIVICDNIYTSVDGKTALVGLFNRIVAPEFPTTHRRMGVLISLIGAQPGQVFRAGIVEDSSGEMSTSAELEVPNHINPKITADLCLIFQNVQFPESGQYRVGFFEGATELGSRPFAVVEEEK